MNSSLALDLAHDVHRPQPYQYWQEQSNLRDPAVEGIRRSFRTGSLGLGSWTAPSRAGLPTPPTHPKEMMTGLSLNPINGNYGNPQPNLHVKTHGPPMNSGQMYHSNQATNVGGMYQTQPVQTSQENHARATEQSSQRKQSSNTIASYLQIPSSINDSKGSLAEFAAQITCLFWFESSNTLQRIEDVQNISPVQPLVAEAIPTTGFRKWVTTILSTTQVTQNVVLLALLFIYRLKKFNLTVRGKSGSEYRLLTVALMLGNKFLDDNTYTNKTWAEVSGISVQEIHIMEVEFLSNMRYTLFTSEHEWKNWHIKLARFWNYFDRASRTPELPRPHGPLTPTLLMPPSLPSPPGSTHTSPPYMSSQPTPSHMWPTPQSFQQYATHSPIRQLPGVDFPPTQRKRSYDEQIEGPPAKRITRSMTPSAMPSTTLAPLHGSAIPPHIPRLPAPNITQHSNLQHFERVNNGPQLPLPGSRAMSTVYNGGPNWPQSNSLPPSGAPTPLNIQTNMLPSLGDHSRHQSPFPTSSVGSSPITSMASHSQPQNHLSPSYFLTYRNSPYRPVRSVNTLLIPPPSTSMQAPRNLTFDQMRYQPLGKVPDHRTGMVPYVHQHHDPWPQLQEPHSWPVLPQPNYSQG